MSTREKWEYLANNIYFITFTILWWKDIFVNDKYCNLIYKWFDYMKIEYWNKIHWYVIMPNHFHWLIYFSNKSPNISKVIQNAKRFLAYWIVKYLEEDKRNDILKIFEDSTYTKSNAKHKVFRDHYDSKLIESYKFFLQKLEYIHNNPCAKHWNLSNSPENYKYSSTSNYLLWTWVYDIDLIQE